MEKKINVPIKNESVADLKIGDKLTDINKVPVVSIEEMLDVLDHLDNQNSVLEVSLICIEHLNFKGEKPSLTDDYYLFLGLYKAYMYARYDELIEYIKLNLI